MTFDRLFALAEALGFENLTVRFGRSEDAENQWQAMLSHHLGTKVDYGPTPADALVGLESCLTRLVEAKLAPSRCPTSAGPEHPAARQGAR